MSRQDLDQYLSAQIRDIREQQQQQQSVDGTFPQLLRAKEDESVALHRSGDAEGWVRSRLGHFLAVRPELRGAVIVVLKETGVLPREVINSDGAGRFRMEVVTEDEIPPDYSQETAGAPIQPAQLWSEVSSQPLTKFLGHRVEATLTELDVRRALERLAAAPGWPSAFHKPFPELVVRLGVLVTAWECLEL